MTDDVTRRLWWRWMAGMVDQHGRRVIEVGAGRNEAVPVEWSDAIACDVVEMYEHPDDARAEWEDAIPDPTDPATLGCLLALARELTGDQTLHASCRRSLLIPGDSASGWTDGPWDAVVSSYSVRITIASGLDEWSALVAACDAAWGRR